MIFTKLPIVLIHGAFGQSAHFAARFEVFSRAGYQCRAPLLPGWQRL
jgi:pimeloyl-ACP methyl ester carboxylesterase